MELTTEGRNTQSHQAAEGMAKVFGFLIQLCKSQVDPGKSFKSWTSASLPVNWE